MWPQSLSTKQHMLFNAGLCADVKRMAAAQTGAVWGHGTATSRLTQIDLVVASEILLQTPEY